MISFSVERLRPLSVVEQSNRSRLQLLLRHPKINLKESNMSYEKRAADARAERHRMAITSGFNLYLSRPPTATEVNHWLEFLRDGGTLAAVLTALREGINSGDHVSHSEVQTKASSKSVGVLSTYPPEPPQHGGQHRVRNIGLAFKGEGYQVKHWGVLGSSGYSEQRGFLPFPGIDALSRFHHSPSLMEDWCIGQLFVKDEKYYSAFVDMAGEPPDVIHVEQPWLFQMAERWASSSGKRVKLLYGSANVEHTLKFDILRRYFGEAAAREASQKVLDCELAAIKGADAVLAVSANDLEWISRFRADGVLLAANGVAARETTVEGIIEANVVSRNSKFALICASAHPPNISSMFDIFGGGFSCFSPGERLVLAGSIGPAVRADGKYAANTSLHNFMSDGGIVSEACIQGLLETAHAILLPITSGEGSNLKTAEALWAGKHIVATRLAMRGFEQYMEAEGLTVAEDAESFLNSVRRAMERPPLEISAGERAARQSLLWNSALKPMVLWANA